MVVCIACCRGPEYTSWPVEPTDGDFKCFDVLLLTGRKTNKKNNYAHDPNGFSPLPDWWPMLSRSCWRSSGLWRTWSLRWTPPTPSSTRSSTSVWRAASALSTSPPEPWPLACWAAWCVSRASSPSVSWLFHFHPLWLLSLLVIRTLHFKVMLRNMYIICSSSFFFRFSGAS